MAEWSKERVDSSDINGGKEFTSNDNLAVNELNAIVNNSFYGVEFVEAMADAPDVSEIDGTGTPSVSLVDNGDFKRFKFSNLRGQQGEKGQRGEKGEKGDPVPNTLSIGTVQGGTNAFASISGDAPNQQLNLILPQGDRGATIHTGTKITGTGVGSINGTLGFTPQDSDIYINSSTYDVYQFYSYIRYDDGDFVQDLYNVWINKFNIKGEKGDAGVARVSSREILSAEELFNFIDQNPNILSLDITLNEDISMTFNKGTIPFSDTTPSFSSSTVTASGYLGSFSKAGYNYYNAYGSIQRHYSFIGSMLRNKYNTIITIGENTVGGLEPSYSINIDEASRISVASSSIVIEDFPSLSLKDEATFTVYYFE